ncbi:hypothetical protein TNCV_1731991 [Trichonephila clavipes]|nr:hypothetical protein TNCV_1731991 [Trichonephila clavipes]
MLSLPDRPLLVKSFYLNGGSNLRLAKISLGERNDAEEWLLPLKTEKLVEVARSNGFDDHPNSIRSTSVCGAT